MGRAVVALFSVASYGLFLLVFLYLLAFLVNLPAAPVADAYPLLQSLLPYAIDAGREAPAPAVALLVNLALIALFGLQHSVMARPGFKRFWNRVVTQGAERSVYVLFSSVVLMVVMWGWQPMPETALWQAESGWSAGLAYAVMAAGVALLLWSTFLIDHFELFGLKQAWAALRRRVAQPPRFQTPWLYGIVRHPLYLGWFLIFWATPHMSVGHLLFAGGMTAYIFVAIRYEERDLIAAHGDQYAAYREQVPMVFPRPGRRYQGGGRARGVVDAGQPR